ncbi:MAG: DUF924 family protein [Casimicrobiaceae bacterium]
MENEILDFWFGAPGTPEYGTVRDVWFRKGAAFDATIASRFGALVTRALAGSRIDDIATPRGALARVLVLDQFTRNIYRDSATAFAGDASALAISNATVAAGDDRVLIAVERWFLYMPFEHAESVAAQGRSIELFTRLRDDTGLSDPLVWAEKHAQVIRRFGRFPHRNDILGRPSTPAEIEFLAQPGSRF